MKKFLNNPDRIMDETMKGFELSNKKRLYLEPDTHRMVRRNAKEKGKVKLVVGNGGGHEPGLMGWVGYGMYDLDCLGDIFAAQSGKKFFEAIESIDDGSPVLLTIANHAGDVMNGNMAFKLAKEKGMCVEKAIFYDDVASAPKGFEEERRGMAGIMFSIKAAGAMAEAGESLEECARVFEKARDNTRTVSVALTSCTHPQTGMVMMSIPQREVNIGAGIHGEGGAENEPFGTCWEMMEKAVKILVEDKPYEAGDEVVLLINGMGSTTMMEMSIIYQDVCRILEGQGIRVYDGTAGNYITTQEMGGVSLSICKVDDELKTLWDAPCSTPAYTNG